MKNKLFILTLVVLGLVLMTGTVLAEEAYFVDEMTEEELQNYESVLPLTQNSNISFRTGANLGTITHLIESENVDINNQIKKQFVTGQLKGKLDLGSDFLKELNFTTEQSIKSYEADFINEYNDSGTETNTTFTNENDSYGRFDFNAIMNRENSNNLNKSYYGFGFESEDKTFTFDETSNINKYNIKKTRPYLMKKVYTTGGIYDAIMTREWKLSYVQAENTVGVNGKDIATEFHGAGILFDVEAQFHPTENLTVGGGYTFNYDYMVGKEENSGDELAGELGLNNNDILDETLRESSHLLYVSATLSF
jgi:hypothetical protein